MSYSYISCLVCFVYFDIRYYSHTQEMDASDDWKCFACYAANCQLKKEKEQAAVSLKTSALLPSWVDGHTLKSH